MKRWAVNLFIAIFSLVLFFGATEIIFSHVYTKRSRSYFDDQVEKVLGHPAAKKAPGEYRIFIFGGSAAYGFPLSDRHSIAAWLRTSFRYLLPDKTIRVINCGWPGKASHHVREGARAVLRHQPDLYLIYSGHNDTKIENRLYLDNWLYRLNLRLSFRSATYRFLANRLHQVRKKIVHGSSGAVEKHYREEIVAMKVYNSSELRNEEYGRILQGFRENAEDVIRVAEQNKITVMFFSLPSNIRSVPPASSFHKKSLSEEELKSWQSHYDEGIKLQTDGRFAEALEAYQKAWAIDSEYAELHYRLGQSYEGIWDLAKAKEYFSAARDWDGRPTRGKSSLNALIQELATQEDVLFLDLAKALAKISIHGIIGGDIIYDDVHPTIQTQQVIADEVLKLLSERGLIAPASEWQWSALEQSRQDKNNEDWKIEGSLNGYHYILHGLHLWEKKRYKEVVPDLERGLEMVPSFLESYAFIADAYLHLGQPEKAKEAFQKFKNKDTQAFQSMLKTYPDLLQSYQAVQAA